MSSGEDNWQTVSKPRKVKPGKIAAVLGEIFKFQKSCLFSRCTNIFQMKKKT